MSYIHINTRDIGKRRCGANTYWLGVVIYTTLLATLLALAVPAKAQEVVYNVEVTPDSLAVTVNPGSASYTFVVKNRGNGHDTFDLVATCSGAASACSPAVNSVAASAGSSKNVVVNYTAASAGGQGTVSLRATSRGDPGAVDYGSIRVTVPRPFAVEVTPDAGTDTIATEIPASRVFTIRNSGTQRAGYLLRLLCSGPAVRSCALAPSSVTLDPTQAASATVSYSPGADADTGSISVTAKYAGDTTVIDNGSTKVRVKDPCKGTWGKLGPCFRSVTNPASSPGGLQQGYSISHNHPMGEPATYAISCVPSGAVTSCWFPQEHPTDTIQRNVSVASGSIGQFKLRYTTIGRDTTGSVKVIAQDVDSLAATLNVVITPPVDPGGAGGAHLVAFDLTPDYQTVTAEQNASISRVARLTNRGTRVDTFTVTRSCAGSAIVSGCSPASEQQILAAGAGVDLPLSLTTSALPGASGTARIVVARQSEPGGPDTSRFDIRIPATPSRVVDVASANPGYSFDRSLCLQIAADDDAGYDCGTLRVIHELPATMMLSTARVPTPLYNSAFADPRGIVGALVHVPSSASLPTTVTASLTIGGTVVANGSWSGSDWRLGETRRIALDFDAASYSTGIYRYVLSVVRNASTGAVTDTASGDLIVVNRRSSPFGAGWWLAGLEQLVTRGDTLLWVGGDGSAQRYLRDPAQPSVFRGITLDQRDSITWDAARQLYARQLPNRLRVEYSSAGQHLRTINRRNDTTTFRYDGATPRCLTSIALPPSTANRVYRFAYNDNCASASSRLVSVAAPGNGASRNTAVAINASNQVDSITGPDGRTVRYAYVPGYAGRIASRTDRRSTTTSYGYGPGGALVQVETVIDTGAAGTIRTTFAPQETRGIAGQAAVSLENAHTALDGPRTDLSDTTRFWADRFGAPVRVRNALGDETLAYREDARFPALVTKVRAPSGAVSSAAYDALGRVTQVADSSTCDAALGRCATTAYTWKGDWHLVATVTPPLGVGTTYEYDDFGNLLWQQPGSDATRRVQFGYHQSLRLPTSTLRPGVPARDSVGYDSLGNVRFVQSELGVAYRTVFYKDSIGLDTLILSPIDVGSSGTPGSLFLRVRRVYDAMGRDTLQEAARPAISSANGPSNAATHYQRKRYDAEGNLERHAQWVSPDPNGIDTLITTWVYDRANRKIKEIVPRALRFPGEKYDSTVYNPAGNVVLYRTRGGNRISMEYDALGRMLSRIVPSKTVGIFSGYTWGNRVPADTIRQVFDGERLTAASNFYSRIRRRYNANGTLAADTLRIRTADTLQANFGEHVYGLAHGYDLNGRRIWTKYPSTLQPSAGKDSVAYGYDDVYGGLAWVEDMFRNRQTFTYTLDGQLETRAIPGGITTRNYYYADGSLRRRTEENGASLLHDDSLSYDARGKLTRAATWVGSAYDLFQPEYDGLGALTYSQSYNEMKRTERLTVDALQNVVSISSSGTGGVVVSPRSYEPGNGQLTKILGDANLAWSDTTTYDYEGSGNRTFDIRVHRVGDEPIPGYWTWLKTSNRHWYSADDRLIAVAMKRDSVRGGSLVGPTYHEHEEYWYDAFGRRITSRVQRAANCKWSNRESGCRNEVVRAIWDGDQIIAEVKTSGESREADTGIGNQHFGRVFYVHAGAIDKPVAIVRMEYMGTTVAIPHTNYRGVFDSGTCLGTGGVPCDRIEWPAALASAYMELARSDTGETNWFGSLVAEQSGAAGLMYRRNRYYDPASGTFTQPDPIGLAGGLNAYGYADGDPVSYSDPFGLCPFLPMTSQADLSDCPPFWFTVLGSMTGALAGAAVGGGGGLVASAPTGGTAAPIFVPAGALLGAVKGAIAGAAAGAALDVAVKMATDNSGGSGDKPKIQPGETANEKYAFRKLGLDRHKASDLLHELKRAAGLRGGDNVWINTTTGDVRTQATGELIGSLRP